ncbi:MAG: chemotaxis protein CheR [Betaproteobacteria bacterium]|nr:chemotaxis protein CheR [Betaproteobacteria bacterium]
MLPAEQRPAPREFLFTFADFERVRRLIHERAGIALGDHKQEMVYSRLVRRLRALKLECFRSYLDLVEADRGAECNEFTNALTTNLTAFFREAHHFDLLRERLRTWALGRRVRIWCAASSTGEEPYSIAMTMVEAFSSWTPPCEVIASDVDTTALRKAEQGLYALERVKKLDAERLRRYFVKASHDGAQLRIRPELRSLVSFQRVNLLSAQWPLNVPCDAVFCRNVLIYFDRATQRRIIERFLPLLRAEGLLFVGHSEGLFHCTDLFRSLGRTVYAPLAGRAASVERG